MNEHETAARLRKATKLADALIEHGFTLEDVTVRMTAHHWHIVATAAGCNPPSEKTIEMVKERMRCGSGTTTPR